MPEDESEPTNEQLKARIKHLEEENRKWMRLAGTNRLTGLPNSLMLYQIVLPRELGKATQQSISLACILLCPDGLGEINQKHGRLAGDQLLTQIGQFLKSELGEDEQLFHVDGANFCILILNAFENKARRRATEIKNKLKEQKFTVGKLEFENLTSSVGVAEIEEGIVEKEKIKADVGKLYQDLSDRLYKAKEKGGNSVVGSA